MVLAVYRQLYVNAIFRQSEHVGYILSICNQRLYLLKVLRALGLDRRGLDCVFHAIIVSRLIYAIEAWGNFVNKEQEGKINKTLKKANKWGLSTYLYTFSILRKRYAENLFTRSVPTLSTACFIYFRRSLSTTIIFDDGSMNTKLFEL